MLSRILGRKGKRNLLRHPTTTFFNSSLQRTSGGDQKLREKYEIKQELGSGRFGYVREGVDLQTGDAVAIKTIPKGRRDMSQEMKNEVQLLEKLHGHPNCMRINTWIEESSNLHIITELYTGGELFDRILEAFSPSHHDDLNP